MTAEAGSAAYLVGRGMADITGPAAEIGMMGYSRTDQKTEGIHQRLRSRAFVVADPASGRRVAYVNADLAMVFRSVKEGVLAKLRAKYGDTYTDANVLMAGTHTHSGPGGYSHNLAYNLSIGGLQQQNLDAIVAGITASIEQAHADLAPGSIGIARGELTNASVNRSRVAWERNPEVDKAVFPQAIDPSMTVLRFRQGSEDVGAQSWFAVHNTSITGENHLISPDNKGAAQYFWERRDKGQGYLAAGEKFVASFANTNAGDMSPNLNLQPGSGPTEDEWENSRIIGTRQKETAQRLYASTRPLAGPIDYRLQFVDMSQVTVDGRFTPDGQPHQTCSGALGASMTAGSTEDGPALPVWPEGTPSPLVPIFEALKQPVPDALRNCQHPKQDLLATGSLGLTPNVLPVQLVRIGDLALIGMPGEVTITSGLRLRRAVAAELGLPLDNVIVQAYANDYSQFVTTPEEYDSQQYEGGSTLFGRYTLPAYVQTVTGLASAMRTGAPAPASAATTRPPFTEIDFQSEVLFDDKPIGKGWGETLVQPAAAYARGQQAKAVFVTGHPKNNLRLGGTFLEVQRLEAGQWRRIADDNDWETRYRWAREGVANSTATVEWDIPSDAAPGTYRLVHHGDWKSGWTGKITPLTGVSRAFTVS
ncbi:neutral/alkaline ceramidase [Actinomycetota bacterium]